MSNLIVLGIAVILIVVGASYFSYSGNVILGGERPNTNNVTENTISANSNNIESLEPSPNIDKCKDMVCERSSLKCPDGVEASCPNTCSNNSCSICKPSCSGHEKIDIDNIKQMPIISALSSPSISAIESSIPSTNIETSTPTQTPQPQTEIKQPKIIYVKADADGDDRKKENWNTEWVEIDGLGVDMSGWKLLDNSTHVFVFPEGFIINGLIKVRSGYGNNTKTDLYFGDGPIWNNNGDVAHLKDKNGNLVDRYSYGG